MMQNASERLKQFPGAAISSYEAIKTKRPSEQNTTEPWAVSGPKFWPNADIDRLSQTQDRVEVRTLMARPGVLEHFGQATAQAHKKARKELSPSTDLKTTVEARERWQESLRSPQLIKLSPLDPQSALNAVEFLGRSLWLSTPERIEMDYNAYGEALSVDAEGAFHNAADHTAHGFHAWFEPLARIDYTSRTSFERLEGLLDAYSAERNDVSAEDKATWQQDLFCCRTQMDLLYVSYFLRLVPESLSGSNPTEGDGALAIASLRGVVDRLREDLSRLGQLGIMVPSVEFRSQDYLQNSAA